MEYPHAPLEFRRLTAEERLMRSREFQQRMEERRSLRFFSAEPVEFELIENAIRCAAHAPSGANLQPWRFAVVSDAAIKKQIREGAEEEEREFYQHRCPPEWREVLAPLGTDWHKEFLETAPYLIVVFAVSHGLRGGQKIKHYYVQESVGIACGFLLAGLHLAGLATLTHTPSPMGFLNGILGRPANERPYLLVPVGYPAPDATVPVIPRKPLREVLLRFPQGAGPLA